MKILLTLLICSIVSANEKFDPIKLLKMGKKLVSSDPAKAVNFLERAYLVRYPKADIQKGVF